MKLTYDQVAAMPAGRDMDVQVAKLLGWSEIQEGPPHVDMEYVGYPNPEQPGKLQMQVPHYSMDAGEVMHAVRDLLARQVHPFRRFVLHGEKGSWWAWFDSVTESHYGIELARVICQAILYAGQED